MNEAQETVSRDGAASATGAIESPTPSPAAPNWLARLSAPALAVPFLGALGMLLFIVNLGGYPLYTKGEPREAVTIFDILNGGGVILPMRAGVDIPSKPLMMHWLAAIVSLLAGGISEWTVRMPSALLAIGTTLACYLYVRRLFDDLSALLAGVIMATTFQVLQSATGARVDMTLTFFMAVALLEFILLAQGKTTRWVPMYLAAAAAVLSKGPVGVALPALIAVVWIGFERRFDTGSRLHLARGALIVAVLGGGWYLAASAVGGAEFIRKHLWQENVFTFLGNKQLSNGHAHPFYYLELSLIAGFMPWTFFLPGAFVWFARRRATLDSSTTYLLLWVAVVLVFYGFAHSKRSVYLLALYPALAALTGTYLANLMRSATKEPRWVRACSFGMGTLLLFSGAGALLALASLWAWPAALGAIFGKFGITAPGFVRALGSTVGGLAILAVLIPGSAAALGSFLIRTRSSTPKLIAGVAAGFCLIALAINLFVEPAVARTLNLKQFAIDAMRTVGDQKVAYLGALNFDVAFYSKRNIPIAMSMDARAPDYLIVWGESYDHLPPEVRRQWPVVLRSGPTELDGTGWLDLVRRGGAPVVRGVSI